MSAKKEKGREMRTAAQIKNRRIERMRLGQSSATVESFVTDPEQRVALVPLTQGEYIVSLHVAGSLPLDDNIATRVARDEMQRAEVLAMACREVEDLTLHYFENGEAVRELDALDINHLWDCYREMVAEINPHAEGLSEEDFSDLKKALQNIEWSELSGPQWYAAQRFLNSIRPLLLTGNVPGFSSTSQSTKTNDESDTTTNAGKTPSS